MLFGIWRFELNEFLLVLEPSWLSAVLLFAFQLYYKNNVTISGQYDSEERTPVNGEKSAEDVVKALGGQNFVSKEIYAEASVEEKPNQKVGMS